MPFLSKASGVSLIETGVRVWLGEDLKAQGLVDASGIGVGKCLTGWAVKEAVFSFDRFQDLDPVLGPEMKSTGECMGTGASFGEAYAKAQAGVGTQLPTKGTVFVSVHDLDKESILPIVRDLVGLGFEVTATPRYGGFSAAERGSGPNHPEDPDGSPQHPRPHALGPGEPADQHPQGPVQPLRRRQPSGSKR